MMKGGAEGGKRDKVGQTEYLLDKIYSDYLKTW